MGKTAVSSSGINISGSVRGIKGEVGLGPNSVSLGVDLGIAGLGVTTDYGGAATVNIAGQKITWGIEGGKIELGIGGLEVKVEARDCVVTETKKIFGQVVATRTYPDPGCNPKPPSEAVSPIPQPPTVIPPGSTGLEEWSASQQLALVSVDSETHFYTWGYRQPLTYIARWKKTQLTFPPLLNLPSTSFIEGLGYTRTSFKLFPEHIPPQMKAYNLKQNSLVGFFLILLLTQKILAFIYTMQVSLTKTTCQFKPIKP
ncbi:MAG: hypothetical protein JGK17_29015 [Microcoleus sp. PH2017_10_PVI_O_A]|uniref:hypothetical protein n=1 Tax=unclassified Microcoleus TaxID=2642155 RepID=UPI001D32A11E|nr:MULTISPECIES: hypothetical protein [unclassified Microcoleus]MCC3409524.1 hypothetical protein [Microcoleus sp. PH2017_10_PVI_O_A]MCC3463759.1 hypothetical protein [Microcoleus sp. PH2017_11_PCY_U_A]MCC3482100.1 hypothetical protein [Microcoleus sp. PH2017_12_PCY_D_A]MCC3527724.1 hypothetical protein [Microcoleus sp. PH2017_21_RUC_O_A]MCC3542063.1 hypothetical protein [Microcoleus sp. PH2017_22_RUC_O_B]